MRHEYLTIVSGSIAFGMGDKFDEASMKTLSAVGPTATP